MLADVRIEAKQAEHHARVIEQSDDGAEAIAAAFRGVSDLLLATLLELREIKEELWSQGATPD